MSNMPYCRFENTLFDLLDCREHIWETDLSREETMARKAVVQLCKGIAEEFGEDDEP